MDRGVRRSVLAQFEENSRIIRLDFPIYSAERDQEFIQIIKDEETAKSLRDFLRRSFQDLSNVDELSAKGLSSEICAMAKEHVARLERVLSDARSLKSLRRRKTRYAIYKAVIDPMGVGIDLADKLEQINRDRRAVGFVSDLLGHPAN